MAITNLPLSSVPFEWLDLTNPTEGELIQVSKKYNLHQYTLRDCLEPDHLPKVEDLGDTQFIITRIIVDTAVKNPSTIQQISSKVALFFNEHFIITVHRLPQPFLEEIKLKYLDNGRTKSTRELVTRIVWRVLYSYEKPALNLANGVNTYEAMVFLKNPSPLILKELYFNKRNTAIHRQLLLLMGDVINKMHSPDAVILQDVRDLHTKIATLYDQLHDDITNLLHIYLSLSSQKTNEVMKILTIFSVFFMPLTFIVGIYGMNFKFMPELEKVWGYPAVLISMAIVTVFIFWWFKRKKWF